MKQLYIITSLCLISSNLHAKCNSDQELIFSCQLEDSHKQVEVCANIFEDRPPNIQYRFGENLDSPEIEMTRQFSDATDELVEDEYEIHAHKGMTWIEFINGKSSYALFTVSDPDFGGTGWLRAWTNDKIVFDKLCDQETESDAGNYILTNELNRLGYEYFKFNDFTDQSDPNSFVSISEWRRTDS